MTEDEDRQSGLKGRKERIRKVGKAKGCEAEQNISRGRNLIIGKSRLNRHDKAKTGRAG